MNTCRAAYIELRRFSSIRHFLSVDATKTLMCSLVFLKLDYCNSLLDGSPQYLIQPFQKVQNTAAQFLTLEPQELNILYPSFVPFNGYLYKRESSTRSAAFFTLHWLTQVWSTCQTLSMCTPHPDSRIDCQIAVLSHFPVFSVPLHIKN